MPLFVGFKPYNPSRSSLLRGEKTLSRLRYVVPHSGVIAAFRQYFVKTKVFPPELSNIYARVMDDRHTGDYELLTALSAKDVQKDIDEAQDFVEQIVTWLKKEKWL